MEKLDIDEIIDDFGNSIYWTTKIAILIILFQKNVLFKIAKYVSRLIWKTKIKIYFLYVGISNYDK